MSRNGTTCALLCKQMLSPQAITAVALPPLLWLAAAVGGAGMKTAEAVSAFSFKLFFCTLFAIILSATLGGLLRRRWAAAALYGGMLLLMTQGVYWYGFRFTGEAGAGKGEQVIQYHHEERGAWPGDTRIPARIEKIPEERNNPVEFSLDQKIIAIPLKGSFDWKGFRVSPQSVEMAPLIRVDSATGRHVEALYYKLGTLPPEHDFFLVKTMPHRIYLKQNGTTGVQVRIVRNKLEIAKKDLAWGEKIYYDGHYLSFEQGEPWVRLSVERQIRPYFAAGGCLLLLGGAIAGARKRWQHC